MTDKQKYDYLIYRRRSIRLPRYNYTTNGAYFITICALNRNHVFGQIASRDDCPPIVTLNNVGKIARQCWLEIPDHFPHVEIDNYVFMPNHVHGIIILNDRISAAGHRRGTACRAPTVTGRAIGKTERFGKSIIGSIPTIIRSFKSAVSNRVNLANHTPGESFWQRNYYEHVIRNDNDLYELRKYIDDNPVKWGSDEYNSACQCHLPS